MFVPLSLEVIMYLSVPETVTGETYMTEVAASAQSLASESAPAELVLKCIEPLNCVYVTMLDTLLIVEASLVV